MAIDYVVKYPELGQLVDEKFKLGSKSDPVINKEYDFVGAKTIKVYSVGTVAMGDYTRSGSNRYGAADELSTTLQEMTMTKDRAFTFTIDKMNEDETKGALSASTALARQLKEVVIPEIDTYRFATMATNAGIKATPAAIDKTTIYTQILAGTQALDDAEVPEEGRILVVTPAIYTLLKESDDFIKASELGMNIKITGQIGEFDGLPVLKVPSNRMPNKFGFMIAHPVATTAPVKLAEYKVHQDAPGISGSLVEGRVYYDAFVLKNKAKAIYYHAVV